MCNREYAVAQINSLPDNIVEKIVEYISFQRFNLGLLENEPPNNSKKQKEALHQLYTALATIDDEPFDGELPRFNIKKELAM